MTTISGADQSQEKIAAALWSSTDGEFDCIGWPSIAHQPRNVNRRGAISQPRDGDVHRRSDR
jgi:hypothetical protein